MPQLPKFLASRELPGKSLWNALLEYVRAITPQKSADIIVDTQSGGTTFRLNPLLARAIANRQTSGQGMFPVQVWVDGGGPGGYLSCDQTTCDFTYTVKNEAGEELGTLMTPERKRITGVVYNEPTDASFGIGFYWGSEFFLYEAVEEVIAGQELEVAGDADPIFEQDGTNLVVYKQVVMVLAKGDSAACAGSDTVTGTNCPS